MAESLILASSNFKPPQNPFIRYKVEVRYRPSIPDNLKYWQVFEYEEQIKHFMEAIGEFPNSVIDQEDEKVIDEQQVSLGETITGHKILQLKVNTIPRSLVPLERLFNSNDVAIKPTKQELEEKVEGCNIGTKQDPKVVKLAKGVPKENKQRYMDIFKRYMDVFSWSYVDLKTFDIAIIQHKIPLKRGVKPYNQNLGKINPMLLPLSEKEVRKFL